MKGLTDNEIRDLIRLQLPDEVQGRYGWKLDRTEILRLMDELKLEQPVIIKFRHYKVHRNTGWLEYGNHRALRAGVHQIMLNDTGLSAMQANITLLHEFIHAWQSEDFARAYNKTYPDKEPIKPSDFHRVGYSNAKGEWGASYRGNFFEIQADKISREFADRYKLVAERA